MRKIGFIIASVAIAIIMTSCGKPEGFVVEGTISNYYNNEIQVTVGNKVVATSPVKNGKFELKGSKLDYPVMAFLTSPGSGPLMMFFLENGDKLTVDVDYIFPDKAKVKGSKANHNYGKYKEELFKIQEELYGSDISDKRKKELYDYDRKLKIDLVNNNKDNILGVISFVDMFGEVSSEYFEEQVASFSPEMQAHPIFEEVRAVVKAHEEKFIGDKFIDINSPDANGKKLPLSKVAGQGKYVLLDFWASWCGPCIDEIPHLKEAYAMYSNKGFDIYGVSFDSDREVWKNAISKYGLTWNNVCELEGAGTQSAENYDVISIPANFLIDPDGIIIAKNLRGEELKEKLSELLDRN